MKIVFFSGDMSRSGGTERVLSLIANGLAARGHDIRIFSLTGEGSSFYELDESIKIHWIGSRGLETDIIHNLRVLNRLMKEEKPDFLIDVDIILCFYSVLLKARFPKTHWISWEHFNFYTRFPVNHNLRKVARLIVSRFSECLVVLSDEDKGYYRSNMRLKCRIERIYNPTPYEEMWENKNGISDEDQDISLNEINSQRNGKIALAVGRLTRIKGYDMLLKSWRPVEKKHPDWTLRFVGDGEEEESLKKEAEDLGLKNVEFVGRVEDVRDYYKSADFLVLSSRNEGFVMVLLEAMAYSLPAVAFACKAGVKEVVFDGVNGYLAPPNDMKTLAKKMDKIISDDKNRRLMGKRAEEIIKRFRRDRILDEWEKLFSEMKNH
ncbi:MAG: glycosyltransferase family 4 protein [Lachnospiraceae bacterium]|nr:glycosyltransferase family 4 protein [Lachnospiraceae bacterium]